MHVPPEAYKNLRGILAICIVLAGVFIWLILRDTRPRETYAHFTGKIDYVGQKLGDRPFRDFGKYRYIKLIDFEHPIEVYPGEQTANVDALRPDDVVTIWYILVDDDSWPSGKSINLRYLYKGSTPVYTNDGAISVQIGCAAIGVLFLTCVFSIYFWRKGKINW